MRLYLDNAATSWPKPEAVYAAVERAMRELGAPAGRSAYREAAEVERLIGEARHAVARLIEAQRPENVIFTFSGTDSLNLALHGVLRPGDHVVTSVCEHNSVLRPLRQLEAGGVRVTRVASDAAGVIDPSAIADALQKDTRLVALVHASNVTGALQPIAEVGRLLAERNTLLLVDAAQSLGHVPLSVRDLGADLLAAPGHKGLLGPLGTGMLYLAPGIEDQVASLRQGGTGTVSETDQQPDTLPDKYESGNHHVPGILGLGAGAGYLLERGVEQVRQHEIELTQRLLDGLAAIEGVQIHGPGDARQQLGVVSITLEGYDPQEVATLLDAAYSIQVRSGLHCAPLMHRQLGTLDVGGTIRFSSGPFNTTEHIDAAVQAIAEIASSQL